MLFLVVIHGSSWLGSKSNVTRR